MRNPLTGLRPTLQRVHSDTTRTAERRSPSAAYASNVYAEPNPMPSMTDMSALFSSATYRSLASQRPFEAMERLRKVFPLAAGSGAKSIADAFDIAYETLLHSYRNEYVFKNAIVSKIVFGRHRPSTASAILELALGRSIADVAVFNGTSTVYEVKTDLDSFTRLTSQLQDYRTRVEMVYVVVSERRAASATRQIPEGVGLIALRRQGSLSVIRPAVSNLDQMRADHIFGTLRQSEVADILSRHGLYATAEDPDSRWHELRALFSKLDIALAHTGAVNAFRARGDLARTIATHPSLPQSTRALVYSTQLSGVAMRRLASRLEEPIAPHLG
jgi:hypothetical protein